MKFQFIIIALVIGLVSYAHAGSHGAKIDIVDTAASAGSFNALVAAVKAAEWSKHLKAKDRSRSLPLGRGFCQASYRNS